MHISTFLTTLAGCTTALAIPVPSATVEESWTLEDLTVRCFHSNAVCGWFFTLNTNIPQSPKQAITYLVYATESAGASRSAGPQMRFGNYTVSSEWLVPADEGGGQDSEDFAWTQMTIIDEERDLVIYPVYTDLQTIVSYVKPDQSYTPKAVYRASTDT